MSPTLSSSWNSTHSRSCRPLRSLDEAEDFQCQRTLHLRKSGRGKPNDLPLSSISWQCWASRRRWHSFRCVRFCFCRTYPSSQSFLGWVGRWCVSWTVSPLQWVLHSACVWFPSSFPSSVSSSPSSSASKFNRPLRFLPFEFIRLFLTSSLQTPLDLFFPHFPEENEET